MKKEWKITWLKRWKKEQILIFLLLAGLAIVMLLPVDGKKEEKEQTREEATEPSESLTLQEQLEQQLVETLQQVEGVGMVTVAVTLETSGKKIVEKDIPMTDSSTRQKEDDGSEQTIQSNSTQEETVYEKDQNGTQIPYVVSEMTPEIRGVIVVAQGGGDPVIQQQIQEAVEALFHVEAHKIKVMKMKEGSLR